MAAFALTIFTGAFLLFQVQPLIGKYILPWFGGAPAVWTTCLLFFQALLLGGYAYAHFTSRWLKPRVQIIIHLVLLAAALALLPITPSDAWKPTGSDNPTLRILGLLTVSLGLPYFVLSSTGPLMQQWFSQLNPGRSPYRLYALSNVGSLLALVSYPFFVENHFTRKAQAAMWGFGLVAFVLFCAACAVRIWKSASQKPEARGQRPEVKEPELVGAAAQTASTTGVHLPSGASSLIHQSINPSIHSADPNTPRLHRSITPSSLSTIHYPLSTKLLWLLLPACASILLLAITNKMCQDTAVIPFLWVFPLALYLLSFIICFDNPRWYQRGPFTVALVTALCAICWALQQRVDTSLLLLLTIYSAGLFVCCMVCHGELYRLKPDTRYLTEFYLMISAGGALGGVFVALIAPLLFRDYYELHWGLMLCAALFLITFLAEQGSGLGLESRACDKPEARFWKSLVPSGVRKRLARFTHWRHLACALLFAGWIAMGATLWAQTHKDASTVVERTRNFYGVLTVFDNLKDAPALHHFALVHGHIIHGLQVADPMGATWPTLYYDEKSGAGLAIRALPRADRRIGLVGLGIGTLAAYARTNDYIRAYEINPEVVRLATTRFSYLAHCYGKVDYVLGDARLSLEHEEPQHFDLLALDTFTGDAIPTHVITKEAFSLYERHLKPNGVIAVHVSNAYLDLEPVLANIAREFNFQIAVVQTKGPTPDRWWVNPSFWVLLTHDKEFLNSPTIREVARPPKTRPIPLWTDDFASLFQILQ